MGALELVAIVAAAPWVIATTMLMVVDARHWWASR